MGGGQEEPLHLSINTVVSDPVKPLNTKEGVAMTGSDWWRRLLLTVETVKVCGEAGI